MGAHRKRRTMSARRLGLVWIVCGVAVAAQVRANETPAPKPLPASTAKAKAPRPGKLPSPSQDEGLSSVKFSNPYAPPAGTTIVRRSQFPAVEYPTPTEPKGGLSISMGQDQGGHTTGGLKFGF
jgi:hypothetical protein